MKRLKYTAMALLAAMTAPAIAAEELDTEIAIERQVVPEHRAATRLNLLPELNLPAVKQMRLNPSDRVTTVAIPAYVTTLDPASYATTAEPYPWRGYAAIGYFPAFNLGASAGYRIIDREATTLDAWLQYDGASWHGDMKDFDNARVNLHRHTATIGTALTRRFGSLSVLTADLEYSYDSWNMPVTNRVPIHEDPDFVAVLGDASANLNRIGLNVGWQSRTSDRFSYHAALGYGLMAYKTVDVTGLNPCENSGKLNLGFDFRFGNHWFLKTDLDGEVYAYNYPEQPSGYTKQALVKGKGGINPRIGWQNKNFSAYIGVMFDVMFDGGTHDYNGGSNAYLYPELEIVWTPSGSFSIWGKIKGGNTTNPYSEIYDWSRYAMPTFNLGYSEYINFDGGITIGPWRGASLELRAGYADTSGWLMPYLTTPQNTVWQGLMAWNSLGGFHYGATLSYKYRSVLEVRGSVDGAAHSDDDPDKGWYRWRDRARWVMDAEVGIHPIEPLTITVGHNWRTGRRCFNYHWQYTSLGNVSSLRIGAAYRITPALSVFARGENILNHRHLIMPGLPAQGVAGLVGVTYKLP